MDPDTRRAADAARAAANAADRIAGFVARLSSPPEPSDQAEYAALLAHEQSAMRERTAALHAAGLSAPSLDENED